jgi:hypothetical protein
MKIPRSALLALILAAAGCAAPRDPFPIWKLWGLDLERQADGGVFVPDTPGNWRRLSVLFADEVKCEAQGLPPSGGIATWGEFWHTSFAEIRPNYAHPEKYFALIIDLRRQASLPDLPKAAIAP